MYAVILAAGRGTRLGADRPKPLVEIRPGLSLLGNQVAMLSERLDPARITVVVGFRADLVRAAFPRLRHVLNPRSADTNTAKSLLCALREIDDDVLWMNGDLYFEPPTLGRFLAARPDASRALVDRSRPRAEAVKYTLAPDGAIERMAKTISDPAGEALGMHLVTRTERPALVAALEAAGDAEYFERAVEACIATGSLRVRPVDAGDAFCREVDYPEDLEIVRAYVAQAGV